MTAVQRFLVAHVLVATAAFAFAFAQAEQLLASLAVIAVGALWLAALRRDAGPVSSIFMNLLVMGGAAAFLLGGTGILPLVGAVAALGAWDLAHFYQRLRAADRVDEASGVGRDHLKRLGLVESLGFLIGLLGLTTRMQISFWWEVLLAILAMIGLTRLIRYVRSEID